MYGQFFYFNLIAVLFWSFASTMQAQPAQQRYVGEPNERNSEIAHTISIRIAQTYGADSITVESFVQSAIILESTIGIPAAVVIGIAIHESSFKSFLFLKSGNPFAIKAGKDWLGETFSKWDDGQKSLFRKYQSPQEALMDFGYFIQARGWYADALACAKQDYVCVVEGLKKTNSEPGYASNPLWDEAILDIIQRVGLNEL